MRAANTTHLRGSVPAVAAVDQDRDALGVHVLNNADGAQQHRADVRQPPGRLYARQPPRVLPQARRSCEVKRGAFNEGEMCARQCNGKQVPLESCRKLGIAVITMKRCRVSPLGPAELLSIQMRAAAAACACICSCSVVEGEQP